VLKLPLEKTLKELPEGLPDVPPELVLDFANTYNIMNKPITNITAITIPAFLFFI
jgi:hypothetical protein